MTYARGLIRRTEARKPLRRTHSEGRGCAVQPDDGLRVNPHVGTRRDPDMAQWAGQNPRTLRGLVRSAVGLAMTRRPHVVAQRYAAHENRPLSHLF
jgi:hypothetical protein